MIDPIRLFVCLGLASLLILFSGCSASLVLSDDDDVGDDDTSDDDASDDDASDDDDDTGDDDVVDMSYWSSDFAYVLDWSPEAEEYWDVVDCEAPYSLEGPEVTAQHQDLCPSCDHVYQLSFVPNPLQQVEACYEGTDFQPDPFDRYVGLQLVPPNEIIVWRNWEEQPSQLEQYAWGALNGGEFWFDSDVDEWEYLSRWAYCDGWFDTE